MQDELWTVTELAKFLRKSPWSVYQRMGTDEMPPHIRLSERSVRFRRADVMEWLEGRKQVAAS